MMAIFKYCLLVALFGLAACGHGEELIGDWYSTALEANTASQGGIAENERISFRSDGTFLDTDTIQWGPRAGSHISECIMHTTMRGQWVASPQGSIETLILEFDSITATLDSCRDPNKVRTNPFELPKTTESYQYEINGDRMILRHTATSQVDLFYRTPR